MATDPRVAVLGSGVMRSLYGGRLARSGVDVTLVDVREYHSRPCGRTDCVSTSATPRPTEQWGAGDGSGSVEVAATTDPDSVPNVDLVVVFVNCTATATAVTDAAETGLLRGRTYLRSRTASATRRRSRSTSPRSE